MAFSDPQSCTSQLVEPTADCYLDALPDPVVMVLVSLPDEGEPDCKRRSAQGTAKPGHSPQFAIA